MLFNPLDLSGELIDFINSSPTMYNAVDTSVDMLLKNGFEKLELIDSWSLKEGGRYFVVYGESSIAAFTVDGQNIEKDGFRMIGSHTDSPMFKIKPNPEVLVDGQIKLNVEGYGGMIVSSWFDRPLGIAGKVILKNKDNPFKPISKTINIDKPVCIIANLAIHMNREINEGYAYNKQNDVMPILLTDKKYSSLKDEEGNKIEIFKQLIANETGIKDYKDIIDYDLYLKDCEPSKIIGIDDSYISSGRLDNLASLHASLKAIIKSSNMGIKSDFAGIRLVVGSDSEEVGSLTRNGADSMMLLNIIERICISLGKSREDMFRAFESSFMISADLAHAVHPNYTSVADPTNRPVFGKGTVIKINAGKSYASDGYSQAVFAQICEMNGLGYQYFTNRSDKRGGSTIGSITSSYIPVHIVDVGMPILAMHSVREIGNIKDYQSYAESFVHFLSM